MGIFDNIRYDADSQTFFDKSLSDRTLHEMDHRYLWDYYPVPEPTTYMGHEVLDAQLRPPYSIREFVDKRLSDELARRMNFYWDITQEKVLYGDNWHMYGFLHPEDRGGYRMPAERHIGPLKVILSSAVPEGEFWIFDANGRTIVKHRFRDTFSADEYHKALEEGAFDD